MNKRQHFIGQILYFNKHNILKCIFDYKIQQSVPIKLMLGTQNHLAHRKKSTDHIISHKSPYFASVRRNTQHNKAKGTAQNAISITKYPSTTAYIGDDPEGVSQKKKVFKRFGKFEQIDEVYTTGLIQPRIVKNYSDRENASPKQPKPHRVRSNPKDIVFSSKTLALAQKYSSYKSIVMSTPKISRDKDKIRKQNFRTKTRSGNTLHWGSRQNSVVKQTQNVKQKVNNVGNEDWLCQQLIQNQVYGIYDDQF